MRLIIFPGGGNPDSSLYAPVYGLLATRAAEFGYSNVDTSVRWPGHMREGAPNKEALTLNAALKVAQGKLLACEHDGQEYDILARSFGAYVALKSTISESLKYLRRVTLWGTPPLWKMWELFVWDLAQYKSIAYEKGLIVDQTLFPSLEPAEFLLQQTRNNIVVATGTEDKYSTPAFNQYLLDIVGIRPNVAFRPPVK